MLEVGLWVKLNFPASTIIIMQSCENLTSPRCVHDGQELTALMALIKQGCLSYNCSHLGSQSPPWKQFLNPPRGGYGLDTPYLVCWASSWVANFLIWLLVPWQHRPVHFSAKLSWQHVRWKHMAVISYIAAIKLLFFPSIFALISRSTEEKEKNAGIVWSPTFDDLAMEHCNQHKGKQNGGNADIIYKGHHNR